MGNPFWNNYVHIVWLCAQKYTCVEIEKFMKFSTFKKFWVFSYLHPDINQTFFSDFICIFIFFFLKSLLFSNLLLCFHWQVNPKIEEFSQNMILEPASKKEKYGISTFTAKRNYENLMDKNLGFLKKIEICQLKYFWSSFKNYIFSQNVNKICIKLTLHVFKNSWVFKMIRNHQESCER